MNITDLIQGTVASRTTRFAFELLPPLKGDGTRSVFGAIDPLMDFNPAYINVTFHREALKEDVRPDGSREWHIMRRRPGTVGISAAIRRKYDVEVVSPPDLRRLVEIRHRGFADRHGFPGAAQRAGAAGRQTAERTPLRPLRPGHAHAADLVRQIQAMNRGEFIDGEVEECHHSKFSVGVAGYPEKHFEAANAQSDLQYLKEKVDAGADYIVTQMFFDNSKYFDFVERCRKAGITVPIIPGIQPISTPKHLEILPRTFSVSLPEELVEAVRACGEDTQAAREVGIEWAIHQAKGSQSGRSADHPFLHDGTHGQHPQDRLQRVLIPNRAK